MSTQPDFAEQVLPQIRDLWSRLDPLPAGLTDDIKFRLTVRLLEAEVAELTQPTAMASRGETAEKTRSMTFAGSTISLMVSVTEEGDGRRLDCWVTKGPAEVELRHGDHSESRRADEHGRLVFEQVAPGQVNFVVWPGTDRTERPMITPAINL